MFKKIISGLLATVLMLTLITGCKNGISKANNNTSKPVTLKWVVPWGEQRDLKKVTVEVNKQLTKLLPNTKLDLICDSLPDKWPMWMASKVKFDIAWSGYMLDLESEIKKGSYLKLDDLIKNYAPDIKKEMIDYAADYKSGTYRGSLYAIPNQQPLLHTTSWISVPYSLAKYMDIDAILNAAHSSATTTEAVYQELDKYFEKVKAADLMDTDTISNTCDIQNIFKAVATRGYDWIGVSKSGAWMCYKVFNDGKAEIVNFNETPEFKLFIKYAAKWYGKGYISKDILINAGGTGGRQPTASANIQENWYKVDEARGVKYLKDEKTGEMSTYMLLFDPDKFCFNGTSVLGSDLTYETIPFTAENPERAMMLLNLLRSEKGKDLLNLIVYGIKGTHYELIGNDVAKGNGYTIQPTPNNLYGIPHWMIGNVFLTYRTPNIRDGQNEWAKNYVKNVKPTFYKTPLYDFRADTSNLTSKISQMAQVISEYQNTLICGVSGENYNNVYQQMVAKSNAAGVKDIAKELQKQADAYAAQKAK